jgi:hypothetical protein
MRLRLWVLLCAAAAPAWADEDPGVRAYCDYVEGGADAESDVLIAPDAFVTFGEVSGADASPGGSALAPTERLIAGLRYSFSGLYRGLALRSRARAECKRYRSIVAVRRYLEAEKDDRSAAALSAKAAVLEAALPKAEAILNDSHAALAANRTTAREVEATELRVNALRAAAAQTRIDLDSVATTPPPANGGLEKALAARDAAEAEVERQESRVRSSQGWDLVVRGGYDRIWGQRDETPLFAMVTLSVNVGWLFQGAANDRAVEGRRAWSRHDPGDPSRMAMEHMARMQATLRQERIRLAQSAALLSDLEARSRQVAEVGGEKAKDFADYMFFDLVNVKAEHEYLRAHVDELAKILGEKP